MRAQGVYLGISLLTHIYPSRLIRSAGDPLPGCVQGSWKVCREMSPPAS